MTPEEPIGAAVRWTFIGVRVLGGAGREMLVLPLAAGTGAMHALIIEDEPLVALSIEDGLRDCGYRSFAFATNVEEAVAAAQLRCPDLISADVQLSLGCGIDAVASICEEKHIPVIFITGTPGDIVLRRPGSIIVHKPFENRDIKHAVSLVFKYAQTARDETTPLDTEYYRRRAEAERSVADKTSENAIAAIHRELAQQYEALANQPELRSNFRIKWSAPSAIRPPKQASSAG